MFVACVHKCQPHVHDVSAQALKRYFDTGILSEITSVKTLSNDPKDPAPIAEPATDAAPTSASLADISRATSSADVAASFAKIDTAAQWAPRIAGIAAGAFEPDHMTPVNWTAATKDFTVKKKTMASAEQEVQETFSDKPAAEETAASDKVRTPSSYPGDSFMTHLRAAVSLVLRSWHACDAFLEEKSHHC